MGRFLLGAFLLLSFLVPARYAGASEATNLDLANRFDQSIAAAAATISNPHAFPCKDCHETIGEGRFIIYLIGDDTMSLCTECHPDSNIHPVGITAAEDERTAERIGLPLGKKIHKGKIICLTCHYAHNKNYRRNLLRGDDERGKSRRELLCSRCHGDNLRNKSPHYADPEGKFCHFCHSSPPKPGQASNRVLNPEVQKSCDFCHDTLAGGHYLAVNPFADPDITWRFDKVGIPLLKGQFTCISCHDPHGVQGGRTRLLRPAYLRLAARSTHIEPHWKDTMCLACHEGEPSRGNASLRNQGDINALCNRCHTSRYARRDLHPVGVAPSDKVKIPASMPLKDGKLTCETCHDSSLQEGGGKKDGAGKKNRKFLRGKTASRVDFCLSCHLQEVYGKMNAHDQIDTSGKIKIQSCLFCHSSLPDPNLLGISHIKFSTETLDEYCICCHGMEYAEGHPVAPHLVEPSEKMRAAIDSAMERLGVEFPLYHDRITCATCHNPHQEGVIIQTAAATGAKQANRLRLPKGREMCVGCHIDK